MGSANERRRYDVTSSLIGWAHTQNAPCCSAVFGSPLWPVGMTTMLRPWQPWQHLDNHSRPCCQWYIKPACSGCYAIGRWPEWRLHFMEWQYQHAHVMDFIGHVGLLTDIQSPSGIVLDMGSASERQRYTVTPSLIGWAIARMIPVRDNTNGNSDWKCHICIHIYWKPCFVWS